MPTNVSVLKGSSTVVLGVSPMHGEPPSSLGSFTDFWELSLLLYLLQGAIVNWNPLVNLTLNLKKTVNIGIEIGLNWKSPGKNLREEKNWGLLCGLSVKL